MKTEITQKYVDGIKMIEFTRIDNISHYNNNYYIGFNKDLLFAESDDDNTTEWYLVNNKCFHYLGESYTSNGEILKRFDTRNT